MSRTRKGAPTRSPILFGRDDLCASLVARLDPHPLHPSPDPARLLTLTGPPGVGKTAILRAVIATLSTAARHPSHPRTTFVSLEGVGEDGIVAAIARALQLGAGGRVRATAIARIGERLDLGPFVLALDGIEHVRETVTSLVEAWLDGASDLRVLLGSRERLDRPAEHVVRVDPLPIDAAAAMLQAAVGRGHGPLLADDEARRLAGRVDGLPLGIELLASRVAALGIGALGDAGGTLPRLQSLDDALEESWRALGEDARTVFAAVSFFQDGFSLAHAAALLPTLDVATALERLVNASLVRRIDGADARFAMLTVVRAFAARKLADAGNAEAIAERHRDTMLAFARQAMPAALAGERANVLAAFALAVQTGAASVAAHLAVALDPVLVQEGPAELHRAILTTALDRVQAAVPREPGLEAALLRCHARFLGLRGRTRDALALLVRAEARATEANDPAQAAWIAAHECFARRPLGELDAAVLAGERALGYARSSRELRLEAMAEQAIGLVALARHAHGVAHEHFVRGEAAAKRANDGRLGAICVGNRALALYAMGDLDRAREAHEASREAFAASHDRYHLARITRLDVALARVSGEHDRAEETFASGIELLRDQGDVAGEAELLLEGARVANARDSRAHAEARIAEARLLLRDVDDVFLDAELAALTLDVRRTERGDLTLRIDREARRVALVTRDERRVVRPDLETTIDLSRRAALRRILVALVAHHATATSLSTADALAAGWPGERMRAESGTARVYMAIRRLRALGLDAVLLTRDDGYALDPALRIENC